MSKKIVAKQAQARKTAYHICQACGLGTQYPETHAASSHPKVSVKFKAVER